MRRGWWNCAEALASNTNAEDLHSVISLESRTITTRIGSLKTAVEAMRKPSQLITPAFQWAQSPDSIFLNVKFSHKVEEKRKKKLFFESPHLFILVSLCMFNVRKVS
jgi:hypothetical protein